MLGSVVFAVSITATQNIGSQPSSMPLMFSSVSISNCIGFPLLAHLELTANDNFWLSNLPYTMGVAIASTPQAAKNRSPELAAIL
jgi:hypothetical protein